MCRWIIFLPALVFGILAVCIVVELTLDDIFRLIRLRIGYSDWAKALTISGAASVLTFLLAPSHKLIVVWSLWVLEGVVLLAFLWEIVADGKWWDTEWFLLLVFIETGLFCNLSLTTLRLMLIVRHNRRRDNVE